MASVLMVIVILFFLCHSSRIIVNLYEALQVILNLLHIHWFKKSKNKCKRAKINGYGHQAFKK
jgi:hypothetical protein